MYNNGRYLSKLFFNFIILDGTHDKIYCNISLNINSFYTVRVI